MPITPAREARLAIPQATPGADAVATPASPTTPAGEPSTFQRLLHGIGREVERGESTVRQALHAGGAMGAPELLALQAGVYRYSESVDLAAKLVDRASSGLKTIVQGQS
jgi:hypothetical protein